MSDGTPTSDVKPTATNTVARSGLGRIRSLAHRPADDQVALPVEGSLPSLDGATTWLNAEPLTPAGLRGRVVLVGFWTYTCVNWLRTLPYLRAWHATYRDHGLTVIGVHTPEFGFEQDLDNVVEASHRFGVDYAIAVDSDYTVWRAFANHFWPAVYVADGDGRIRYHHFGEGEYAATEMVIQQLLLDAGAEGIDQDLVMVDPRGLEVPADWRTLRSAETYLGHRQGTGFAQEAVARFDEPHAYAGAAGLALGQWGLSGDWTVARHAAVSNQPGGRVAFRFHARDLNLVMGPVSRGASVPFRVFLDGRPAAADSDGSDVGADGAGTVDGQRTYQLIRQSGPIADRVFEIELLGAGVEAYCFTFG